MYPSELRTCVLGAVVAVLLGAGVGFGWHYFADSAVATTAASAGDPRQRDAPGPLLACPPDPREGPVPDVPRLPAFARPNNRPDATQVRGELKVTHALHARRARQEAPSDGPGGDGQVPVH
jgi:hypothetical protein